MSFRSTLSLGEVLTVKAVKVPSMSTNTPLLWITAEALCSDTHLWCMLETYPETSGYVKFETSAACLVHLDYRE